MKEVAVNTPECHRANGLAPGRPIIADNTHTCSRQIIVANDSGRRILTHPTDLPDILVPNLRHVSHDLICNKKPLW